MSSSPPLFVSIELAARIERGEARLSAALGGVAAARRPETAFVDPITGGVAVFTSSASPVNKMIGVGFEGVPSDEVLAAVEEKFRARGAELQAEVSTLAATAFGATLTRRGYVFQGFENVLGRQLDADDAEATEPEGFEVRLIEAREVDKWLDVSITGFASPDLQGVPAEPLPPRETLERALRELAFAPGFRRYGAWVGERMAAGCSLALVTTQPGSKSQQNSEQQGFALLYSCAPLVKPPS